MCVCASLGGRIPHVTAIRSAGTREFGSQGVETIVPRTGDRGNERGGVISPLVPFANSHFSGDARFLSHSAATYYEKMDHFRSQALKALSSSFFCCHWFKLIHCSCFFRSTHNGMRGGGGGGGGGEGLVGGWGIFKTACSRLNGKYIQNTCLHNNLLSVWFKIKYWGIFLFKITFINFFMGNARPQFKNIQQRNKILS